MSDAADRGSRFLAAALLLLGPLVVLAPRGLPVWVIATTVMALIATARTPALAAALLARPAAPVVVGLLILAGVSIAWSPSPRALLTTVEIGYIALGAAAIGAWISTLSGRGATLCGRALLAGLAVAALLFGTEVLLDFPLNRWWNAVPAATDVMNSNVPKRTSAILALLVWPAALILYRLRGRLAALLPLVLYATASLLLSSRSALLAMVLSLIAFLCAGGLNRRPAPVDGRFLRIAIGVLLAAAFALAVPAAWLLADVLRLDEAGWLFRSAQHRVEIWGHAAARIPDALLAGHGIDASRALTPDGAVSRFSPLFDSLLPLHPHNIFLQVWLELGGLGAALALAITLLVLNATRRLDGVAQPYALGLYVSGLAMASTAYGIWQAWWMAAHLTAGLTLAMAARIPQHAPTED